jgi:hypothetical protein
MVQAPVERLYWYGLYDLPSHQQSLRDALTNWRDPTQFGFGLKRSDNRTKLLWDIWRREGLPGVEE